jgi:hypothetical protein
MSNDELKLRSHYYVIFPQYAVIICICYFFTFPDISVPSESGKQSPQVSSRWDNSTNVFQCKKYISVP